MPRSQYSNSKQGQRTPLDRFRTKYPLLAREGLGPDVFNAVASYMCRTMHADDIDGAMLRLNNLLGLVDASVRYEKDLPPAEEPPANAEE